LPGTPSVWSDRLCSRTCLQFSRKPGQTVPAGMFPDAVLSLLAPFASTVQGGQRTRRLILLIWLCVLTALGISALNNRDLIRQVSTDRSEEHTSELQSRFDLVCRLLLEKKKKKKIMTNQRCIDYE